MADNLLAFGSPADDDCAMKAVWSVRTLLVLVAISLATATYGGGMAQSPYSARLPGSKSLVSQPAKAGMAYMAQCCVGSAVCVSGLCSIGAVPFKDAGPDVASPPARRSKAPEVGQIVRSLTLTRLFRPPRA